MHTSLVLELYSASLSAIVTRTPGETQYPQLDIEVQRLYFALRHFRNYIVGAPSIIDIITNHHNKHKPLCSVKLYQNPKNRHQDIKIQVNYQPVEILPRTLRHMLHTTLISRYVSSNSESHYLQNI